MSAYTHQRSGTYLKQAEIHEEAVEMEAGCIVRIGNTWLTATRKAAARLPDLNAYLRARE